MKILRRVFSNDPEMEKTIHLWLAVSWLLGSIPIILFLRESIAFLVFVSVYAAVCGHWGGYQAAKAELRVEDTVE